MNNANEKVSNKDEQIRKVAHDLWKSEGQPEGQSARHWEQARILVEGFDHEEGQTVSNPERSAQGKDTGEPHQPDQT